MNISHSASYIFGISAAAAVLAGCGGSAQPSYQPPGASQSTRSQSVSSAALVHNASCQGQRSFSHTGHPQTFKVPTCATSIYVDAVGAAGKRAPLAGGAGGEVSATIPVTPGETLVIMVGGAGRSDGGGGFNGGGAGVENQQGTRIAGAGGGGGSDVRQGGNTLADRVVVAGGGGGLIIGHSRGRPPASKARQWRPIGDALKDRPEEINGGGSGGFPDGDSGGTYTCNLVGDPVGGGGGTQFAGGSGGAGTNGGSLGQGAAGVSFCVNLFGFFSTINFSGGGGGGYYGGGGGGEGGGGGGSGYAEPSATNVSSQDGANSGSGSVHICWGYS
ncbi:MAG: glycine-rich protein, partial [Candidatus Tumulicola sp.]